MSRVKYLELVFVLISNFAVLPLLLFYYNYHRSFQILLVEQRRERSLN